MDTKSSPHRAIGEGYKYVALGGTLAGGIIAFMAVGFFLDRWLGLMPLFTIVGTLVGSVLSFLNVYWKLQADLDRERQSSKDGR